MRCMRIPGEHLRILRAVIFLHREIEASGQIEVTMTPFAHSIPPLPVDTNLAQVAMPSAELPVPPLRYGGEDAVAQLERGVELYQHYFNAEPQGMWPAEGSVAQIIVNMVGSAGIRWMASDEGVLVKLLGMDSFARGTDDLVVPSHGLAGRRSTAGLARPCLLELEFPANPEMVGVELSSFDGERWVAEDLSYTEASIAVAVSGSVLELVLPLELLAPAVADEGTAVDGGDRLPPWCSVRRGSPAAVSGAFGMWKSRRRSGVSVAAPVP